MPDLSSLKNKKSEDSKIFSLFVGRSGDGKSVAEASFPRPMKFYDFDFRIDGILGGESAGCFKDVDGIEYAQYHARDGKGFDLFNNELMALDMYRKSGNFPYKTIVVDSLFSMCRILITASHTLQKGKMLGNLRMSGPGDYGFEVSGVHQIFDFLRMLPCNVICSAHIVDKYGKLDRTKEYSESGVVGEKLTVREQLGESILAYFSNVFRFNREVVNNRLKFGVEFSTDLAKNSFGIGVGQYDITGKNFYELLTKLRKDPNFREELELEKAKEIQVK